MSSPVAQEVYVPENVASVRTGFWRAALELMKPLTWFAPMWAFGCGALSAGVAVGTRGFWIDVLIGAVLAGPLMCAMSQTMNDYCDREVDRINEPDRPFPSGRITPVQGIALCAGLTLLSFVLAWYIDPKVLAITVAAFVLSLLYSAPPFRGKRNGWIGNALVGLAYEGVAWCTGCIAVSGTLPTLSWVGALLYSLGAHGIMTLNDFKSMKGDAELGIRSVPVQLGAKLAACIASTIMDVPQVAIIAILAGTGSWGAALLILGLLVGQIPLQVKLIRNPVERAPWYNATGTTLYVLGMVVYAVAVR